MSLKVRSNAAFAIGMLCQFSGEVITDQFPSILQALYTSCIQPGTMVRLKKLQDSCNSPSIHYVNLTSNMVDLKWQLDFSPYSPNAIHVVIPVSTFFKRYICRFKVLG